jgi:hypothetical protein
MGIGERKKVEENKPACKTRTRERRKSINKQKGVLNQ